MHRGKTVILLEFLECEQLFDAAANCLAVGKRSSEPTVIHIELTGFQCSLFDDILGLFLCAYKENAFAAEYYFIDELEGCVEPYQALREVNDVNSVALVEDEALHFRVPALCLVSEV